MDCLQIHATSLTTLAFELRSRSPDPDLATENECIIHAISQTFFLDGFVELITYVDWIITLLTWASSWTNVLCISLHFVLLKFVK